MAKVWRKIVSEKVADSIAQNTTGNAYSATKLETARNIAGNSFNGTANIDIDHSDLSNIPANNHIDWTLASQGTIHATNYADIDLDVDVSIANLTARLPQITENVTIGDASDVTITASGDLDVTGDLTVTGNQILSSSSTAMTLIGANVAITGDLIVSGNDIKTDTHTAITLSGEDVEVKGDLTVTGNTLTFGNGELINNASDGVIAVSGAHTLTFTHNSDVNFDLKPATDGIAGIRFFERQLIGVCKWALGNDGLDSVDTFTIGTNAIVGDDVKFSITQSGNVGVPAGNLTVSGDIIKGGEAPVTITDNKISFSNGGEVHQTSSPAMLSFSGEKYYSFKALTGEDLELWFFADGAEDDDDWWSFKFEDGGDFKIGSNESGSMVDKLTLTNAGNVTIAGDLTGNVTGDITGDLTGDVTGNVTGNVAGNLTGTVLTAAQTSITSVGTLSSLTIGGATQVNSTLTVGVDDTGYDVKFFGDTASNYMLWDTDQDALHLVTTDAYTAQLIIESTDPDSAHSPDIKIHRNSASPADGDTLGRLIFKGQDSGDATSSYAEITATAEGVTATLERGRLDLSAIAGGATTIGLSITGTTVGVVDVEIPNGDLTVEGTFSCGGGTLGVSALGHVTAAHVSSVGNIYAGTAGKIYLGGNTYLTEGTEDILDIYVGNERMMTFTETAFTESIEMSSEYVTIYGNITNSPKLNLFTDTDTPSVAPSMTFGHTGAVNDNGDSLGTIFFEGIPFGETPGIGASFAYSYIEGLVYNNDPDEDNSETGRLEFHVRADGNDTTAITIRGETTEERANISFGESNEGADVTIWGESATSYFLWDQSADSLLLNNADLVSTGGYIETDEDFRVGNTKLSENNIVSDTWNIDSAGAIQMDSATGAIRLTTDAGVFTPGHDADIATKKYVDDNDTYLYDEDDMAHDSAVSGATQQSIKAYVDNAPQKFSVNAINLGGRAGTVNTWYLSNQSLGTSITAADWSTYKFQYSCYTSTYAVTLDSWRWVGELSSSVDWEWELWDLTLPADGSLAAATAVQVGSTQSVSATAYAIYTQGQSGLDYSLASGHQLYILLRYTSGSGTKNFYGTGTFEFTR